jgi:RNA polymerase sigma factor (sigma-70 family)
LVGGLKLIAPLSVDEERRLHPIIQKGREAAIALNSSSLIDSAQRRRLLRLRHAGQEAESLLLQATCGLVRTRVMERGYRFGDEDLEAAGIEGLVNALARFDPEQGTRFSTYANYWIMKLVNQAIQQQAGLTDSEMRLILSLQKFERSANGRRLTKREVADTLQIPMSKAVEVMQISRDLNERRFESTEFTDDADFSSKADRVDAPTWVIDELRRLCASDFDSFWQFTFRTMSIEELARNNGISRQGMSKRIDRCRRAVRESPEAARLLHWFDQQ